MIGRRLAMGECVVADSQYHAPLVGERAGVVRTFVSMKRDPSSCGRERCDSLCGNCRREGPFWTPPQARAELVTTSGKPFFTTADLWLVAELASKRGRAAMRRKRAHG